MLKKDKIRILVFIALLGIIITTYLLVGKESVIMKTVAGASLVAWIITRIILNKKYN